MKTPFCSTQSRIRRHLKLGLSYCLSLASILAIFAEAIAMPVSPNRIDQNQIEQTPITQQESTPFSLSEKSTTSSETAALPL